MWSLGLGDVNCTCPAGYTLAATGSGTPACQPGDPSWPPEAPKCAPPGSVPSPDDPAEPEKILGMQRSTAMVVGASAVLALLYFSLR